MREMRPATETNGIYVKCPCCGWYARSGGSQPLGGADPAQEPLILYMQRRGPVVVLPARRSLTLGEAARDPEWRAMVRRIIEWCWWTITVAEDHGIIANGNREAK